ncbi:MAG: LPS export ABC transporter periplasmic protein LptC [Bacteroidales bacterium]|jgi:LPS export ABC transporter protein LptC|nr:LPS export ABC transporter periplasmic protein LptC [Bacteroidales bacterium]MDZ4059176.1 LPS export ABC transporter periplasmic protein LptC [Bacteroidales bacterium]
MTGFSLHTEIKMVAVTLVIATLLFSCKEEIPKSDIGNITELPTQRVENMNVIQYVKGITAYVIDAPLMERYTASESPYDVFPRGIVMRGYTPEGLLETRIRANFAKNIKQSEQEIWEAYGNVIINNYINGERIETDTLYWNRLTKRIYTHTWVKITTPDLFMQGYGMESDEMARNAVIQNPFDSYAIVSRDSTEIPYIDTANFIGPLIPARKLNF